MSSSPTVLIRVDASLRIGSGHLMRCRNLARGLRNRGANVFFICRRHSDAIHASILDGEFTFLELPSFNSDYCHDQKPIDYEGWLGCSELNDANHTCDAITTAGISHVDAFVIDHYAIGIAWETCIGKKLPYATILVLDDLANRPHFANWLIDASRPKSDAFIDYKNLLSDNCQLMTGAFFALLSLDYAFMSPVVNARDRLRRILVFFGGVDQSNYTESALSALNIPQFKDLDIDVVLASSAPHLSSVKHVVCSMPNARLHVSLASLSGLIVKADLAIGAAGTTSWERACLGLPTIVIPVAKNQEDGASELNRIGAAICLYERGKSALVHGIRSTLIELIKSQTRLTDMSKASIRLGDGRGVNRAVTCLLGPDFPLRIRPTLNSDIWLYYWWTLDPAVRSQSFNTSSITVVDHQAWFQRCLDSAEVSMFVLVDRTDLPLGQIRFERQNDSQSRIKISFSLDRIVRGLGLGAKLLDLGLDAVRSTWDKRLCFFAQVKSDNVASARVFLSYGFVERSFAGNEMREFELFSPPFTS